MLDEVNWLGGEMLSDPIDVKVKIRSTGSPVRANLTLLQGRAGYLWIYLRRAPPVRLVYFMALMKGQRHVFSVVVGLYQLNSRAKRRLQETKICSISPSF